MAKLKIFTLLFCLMAIATIIGCSDTSNLISPNQIDTILDTCDTDIELNISNRNYVGFFEIDKACVDNVLATKPIETIEDVLTISELLSNPEKYNYSENGFKKIEIVAYAQIKVEQKENKGYYSVVFSNDAISDKILEGNLLVSDITPSIASPELNLISGKFLSDIKIGKKYRIAIAFFLFDDGDVFGLCQSIPILIEDE